MTEAQRTVPCLLLYLLLLLAFIPVLSGSCEFPEFLLRSSSRSSLGGPDVARSAAETIWLTEMKFRGRTTLLESQLEVTVRPTEFSVKLKIERTCGSSSFDWSGKMGGGKLEASSSSPCHQMELLYERKCVKKTGDNKYIVLHTDANKVQRQYLCLKFIARSSNVVQLWQGSRTGVLFDRCSDHMLKRDEWLWIAPRLKEWQFCSFVGGFDFWIINATNNEKVCYNEWYSSRVESECVHGDGVTWYFSHSLCSPFDDRRLELKLQCWASWIEDGLQFLLTAEPGRMPQFVTILPEARGDAVFRAHFLFSPRCPLDVAGLLRTDKLDPSLVLMDLSRSESGLCYDESHLCSDYAKREKCNKNGLYLYANKCKKSCGICKLLPTAKPECHFSSDVIGDWVLFETDRKERVTISAGQVTMETLGDYICKSKHWNINYYKALSHYTNGCRPRYTCLRVERELDDTLRFQLGHGSLADNSFELCNFKDDPLPLGKRIHSAEPKILLPWSKVRNDTCGLLGSVGVVTTADAKGQLCQGTLSDWDTDHTCKSQPRLELILRGYCSAVVGSGINSKTQRTPQSPPIHRQEFVCIAYVTIAEGFGLLLTKSSSREQPDRLLCWIVYTYPGRQKEILWSEVHLMDQAQCGHESDLGPNAVHLSSVSLSLTVTSDTVDTRCAKKLNAINSVSKPFKPTFGQQSTDANTSNNRLIEILTLNLSQNIPVPHKLCFSIYFILALPKTHII